MVWYGAPHPPSHLFAWNVQLDGNVLSSGVSMGVKPSSSIYTTRLACPLATVQGAMSSQRAMRIMDTPVA